MLGSSAVRETPPSDHVGVLVPADRARGERSPCWALVVIWCEAEPERVGQTLLVPPGVSEAEVGRGMGEPSEQERLQPLCQHPGLNEPAEPLSLGGVSRVQLRLAVERDGSLSVRNVGRCAMEVNGKDARDAVLRERDVLALRGQIAFVCVRRPELIPVSQAFPASHAPSFGEADRFGVVGESPAAWLMRDSVAVIGGEEDHVIVLGDNGTSMGAVARAIHALSRREGRPLVEHRAGALFEGIGEDELMGDAASGGTLLIEHVDRLRPPVRTRLWKLLDQGGATPSPTRPRLIATTTRRFSDLDQELAARFGLRLWVPPLHERCEDVPFLVRSMLGTMASTFQGPGRFLFSGVDGRRWPRMDVRFVEALVQHDYRAAELELESLLQTAISGNSGDRLALTEDIMAELGL